MNRLKCFLFGHQLYVVQELTQSSRRVACSRCKKSWGLNDDLRTIVEWDDDLERLYTDVFKIPLIKPWR